MPHRKQAIEGLSQKERECALRHLLNNASDTEAGIIRQLLSPDRKPLSKKQQIIYENRIEPSLVEECGTNLCPNFALAGVDYCSTCSIEYG